MIEAKTQVTSLALQKLAASMRDRNRTNRQLATQLTAWVFRNFQAEGALAVAGGWVQLSQSTILARLAKSHGAAGKKRAARTAVRAGASSRQAFDATGVGLLKILQDTGALRNSFHPFSDNEEAGVGSQSNAKHADVSVVHQLGLGRVPARPMLPTPEAALEMAIAVYNVHIEESRKQARL